MREYSKVLCYKTKSLIKLKMTLQISMNLKPHKDWSFFILKFDDTNTNER